MRSNPQANERSIDRVSSELDDIIADVDHGIVLGATTVPPHQRWQYWHERNTWLRERIELRLALLCDEDRALMGNAFVGINAACSACLRGAKNRLGQLESEDYYSCYHTYRVVRDKGNTLVHWMYPAQSTAYCH